MIQILSQQFNAGGPFMWVILTVFAVACAVVAERLIYYFVICRKNGVELVAEIKNALAGGEMEKVHKMTTLGRTPLYTMIKTIAEGYSKKQGLEVIQEGVEEAAIYEYPKMSQRLGYLALMANVATLLGLLGTISGLMTSFSSLASVDAASKASMLASGISEAMITTAFGLIVAVPCMIMYTFLNNKQQALVKDMDGSVVSLLNFIKRNAA